MRVLIAAASALLALPGVHAQVPQIAGYNLTWADDFTGARNTLPDSKNWIIDTGKSYNKGPPNWGTGEIQTYTSSTGNVAVTGAGNLQITAIKDRSGNWTSARIETKQTFMAQPRKKMRIQASLKLPGLGGGGIGYWAAFWTLGAEYRGNYWNWPSVGEIDVMENVNNVNRVWGVLHCDKNPGGACNEPSGLGNSKNCASGSPCAGAFRTYAVEVDRSVSPEAIRWYVEGQLLHAIAQTQVPANVWTQTIQKPHFILLNMAIGGSFPDAIYGSRTPIASTVSGGIFEAQCNPLPPINITRRDSHLYATASSDDQHLAQTISTYHFKLYCNPHPKPNPIILLKMAETCGKCKKDIVESEENSQCERCDVKYCTKSCQNLHWKVHKKSCARSRQAGPSNTGFSLMTGGSARPSRTRGLEKALPRPFTRLERGTYLHDRPEGDVYKLLIDCYRLRMEDNLNIEGFAEPDSIYASSANDGLNGFRRFLDEAKRALDGKLLPPWWNDEKQNECEQLATEAGGYSDLRDKVTKKSIIKHYGDDYFPMQLRMVGEFVWGSAPGGQDGSAMRRAMASQER